MKQVVFAAILFLLCVPCTSSAFARDQRYELLQTKEYDKAIAECTRRIDQREGDRQDIAYSYWVRGFAYLAKNDREHAVQDYSRALDLEPTPDRYFERGELHQSMSRYRKAVEDFRRAAELYEAPNRDARKDRYSAQQARVSAESAAKRDRWDLWFSALLLCAIAGYVSFKLLRSWGRKSAARVIALPAAVLVVFLVIERINPFGWSLRFGSLVQIAWMVAACGFAVSVALLLFPGIREGMNKLRKPAAVKEPPVTPAGGDFREREKGRGEVQNEDWRQCPRCGAATLQMEDVRFCHDCGAPLGSAHE